MIVTSVTVRVPAKTNLQLAVGPLRPDGYHGLVTVFHAIGLFDMITVAAAAADSVTVTGEGAGQVPADGDNLALRAVRALRAVVAAQAGPGVAVQSSSGFPSRRGWPAAARTPRRRWLPAMSCGGPGYPSESCARLPAGSAATWRSRCSAGPRWAAAVASGSPPR